MIKTGIFGGSYNPIHVGHIALARRFLKEAQLDEVWLMVSPQNPLKAAEDLLEDEKRLEMVQAAIGNDPGIIACDYEFRLPKPSYTWDTLQTLHRDFPEREFTLLIGGDNWKLFHRWYRAQDILSNYQVMVYPRVDSPVDESTLPMNVRLLEAELVDVSSTEIRRKVRAGESIEGLVPKGIERMVIENYKI